MNRFAQLPLIGFALLVSLPAVSHAAGSADAANRAACRDRALAEGLRSEEVILDYMFECVESQSAAQQPGVPAASVSSGTADTAGSAAPPPGQGPAAGLD
jgi:hypothetical protein